MAILGGLPYSNHAIIPRRSEVGQGISGYSLGTQQPHLAFGNITFPKTWCMCVYGVHAKLPITKFIGRCGSHLEALGKILYNMHIRTHAVAMQVYYT
jgi:hypothetical protein